MADNQDNMVQKIPQGFCHCGCGGKTRISTRSDKRIGHIKGQPIKYIFGHCSKSYNGKNYKTIGLKGETIREHISLAEKAIGKRIPFGAIVHHHNKSKNGGQLVVCQDQSYHFLLHVRMKAIESCGNASWRKCTYCKRYDDIVNLKLTGNRRNYRHAKCHTVYEIQRHAIKGKNP